MPKIKTKRAAAKRFRFTKTGKIMHKKSFKKHLLEHKSASRKRRLTKEKLVHPSDIGRIKAMLPYR